MRYATVCSGIEAPSVAWDQLGWKPVFFSEIEKFPSKVLNHHYPNTPNLGDMNQIDGTKYNGSVDLICGGTPCQSFSVAGLRKGMSDPRGNLALVFLRLVDQIRPTWVVWENVPGVLSSNKGRDFGSFVGGLGQLGYGWSYRVLDAQYFGVPQRRRRVFVVGHIGGDWKRAAEVLFEQGGGAGDFEPGRNKRERVTGNIETGTSTYRWQNDKDGLVNDDVSATLRASGSSTDERSVGAYIAEWPTQVAPTLDANFARLQGQDNQHIKAGAGLFVMATGQPNAEIIADCSPTINCNHEQPIIFQSRAGAASSMIPSNVAPTMDTTKTNAICVFDPNQITSKTNRSIPTPELCHTMPATEQAPTLYGSHGVRRITPVEAERLQGFPDNYTKINDKTADGPRYKALGNSMAVPVMRWIGERINEHK